MVWECIQYIYIKNYYVGRVFYRMKKENIIIMKWNRREAARASKSKERKIGISKPFIKIYFML